ncbi:uncharacterized protein LOC124161109 [Ischnura elegans]|uniref:uncharacterized protein LOC124161109 n=1 Tax=Ischnura elegans TaxID=197161 RepID=UPI001ED89505|nr:uncharacterized protein LOC124161109 [Ischnura elegans]
MDCGAILQNFKENLNSRIDFLNGLDNIVRVMETQLRKRHDMESLRGEIEETRRKKEQHVKRNDSLRQAIKENKLKRESLLRELDGLRSQEQEVMKAQEARVEHVKRLWKSYELALGFYKKRLASRLEYHEDYIIWTFTNISTDNMKKYMVKLVNEDGRWSCTEMSPKLKSRDVLMETLKETNDIQGFLSNVRSRFKKIANLKN